MELTSPQGRPLGIYFKDRKLQEGVGERVRETRNGLQMSTVQYLLVRHSIEMDYHTSALFLRHRLGTSKSPF